MLQSLILAKEEEIAKSKELVSKLENSKLEPKEKNELLATLELVSGPVRRKIIEEVLNDLNSLEPLFRGTLVKTFKESYEVEIDSTGPERYGMAITTINGEKVAFDPTLDESEREYRPVPKVKTERFRNVFTVETNREQVGKIGELLRGFLERCRGEFRHVSIDKILDEKRRVEYEIATVDRSKMKRENFSEFEFQDASYIKKPRPQGMKAVDAGFRM